MQLEHILANSPLPILIHERSTRRLLVMNLAAETLYGYTQADMRHMTLDDLAVSTRQAHPVHRRKDGGTIDVQLAEHNIKYGKREAVLVVVQDVSHKKNALKFQTMIESASEGICMINAEGIIEQVNPQIETLFQWSADALIGRELNILVPPALRAVHDQHFAQFVKNPQSRTMGRGMDLQGYRKDGSNFAIEISLSPIHLQGELLVMAIITDISERKRLESQLMESEIARIELERAQEMLAIRERFVAMVSHEFRTPLTTIQTTTQILQRYLQRLKHDQIYEQLQRIADQTRRMTDMLEDLLVISRVNTDDIQLEPVPIALETFCYDIWEQLQPTQHTLVCHNEQNINTIIADENLMHHILSNLLSNAIKYSPPGSNVTMEISQHNAEYVIKISDEGMGIAQQDLEYIFEPFFRADDTRTIGGTGLGLTIVKNSVDLHYGHITVQSQQGKGSTFAIHLPLDPSAMTSRV